MTSLTSVLIVDDEPAIRELMARWVLSLGLAAQTAANAEEAIECLQTQHCDLAVIDVMMPGRNGLWLAGELRRDHPNTAVVIATAYTELVQGQETPPIADFLVKPFRRERFILAVDRGRKWRQQALEELEWHAQLSTDMRSRVDGLRSNVREQYAAGVEEIDALVALGRERIPESIEHSDRVARYAVSLARQMALTPGTISELDTAARLHDIGKLAVPEALVRKPGALTPGEMAIMRQHATAGADILEATQTLARLAPIVRASHEWFGGGGYPHKLAGSTIPLASRMISVIDAYDAMTQDRVYRGQLDSGEAVSELLRCAPAQFDPEVVVAFLTLLGKQ